MTKDQVLQIISQKSYDELPEETRADINAITREIRKYRDKPIEFKRYLYTALTKMYNEGMAAVLNGDVVEEGRCINIDRGQEYQITCPYCGETYDINMEGMLQDAEGFGVKVG